MIIPHSGKPGSGMSFPRTPPVVNSNPAGGPKGADGQGVCTPSGYVLSFSEPGFHFRTGTELCLTASDAAVMLRSLLGRGIAVVTVQVLS